MQKPKKLNKNLYLYWHTLGELIKLHRAVPHINAFILFTSWSARCGSDEQEKSCKSGEPNIHGAQAAVLAEESMCSVSPSRSVLDAARPAAFKRFEWAPSRTGDSWPGFSCTPVRRWVHADKPRPTRRAGRKSVNRWMSKICVRRITSLQVICGLMETNLHSHQKLFTPPPPSPR